MARRATRGRQDLQIGLQVGALIQGHKQIKNQQAQIAIAQAQLDHASQAEQNAHARWYFALPAHKQAEYDLGVERMSLQQAQAQLVSLEQEARKFETPRSRVFNIAWTSVCVALGLLLFIADATGGEAGAGLVYLIAGFAVGAWIYFLAPRRRQARGQRARAVVVGAEANIAAIQHRIAELAPLAIDPASRGAY